jgi:hypothetical protein
MPTLQGELIYAYPTIRSSFTRVTVLSSWSEYIDKRYGPLRGKMVVFVQNVLDGTLGSETPFCVFIGLEKLTLIVMRHASYINKFGMCLLHLCYLVALILDCSWPTIVCLKSWQIPFAVLQTQNLSIIHAFDGESFERWYINQEPRKRYPFSLLFPPLVLYNYTLELIFTSNHSPRSCNGDYLHVIYVIVN